MRPILGIRPIYHDLTTRVAERSKRRAPGKGREVLLFIGFGPLGRVDVVESTVDRAHTPIRTLLSPQLIRRLARGEHVGEQMIVGKATEHTALALSACECFELKASTLHQTLKHYPEVRAV